MICILRECALFFECTVCVEVEESVGLCVAVVFDSGKVNLKGYILAEVGYGCACLFCGYFKYEGSFVYVECRTECRLDSGKLILGGSSVFCSIVIVTSSGTVVSSVTIVLGSSSL